ncbi:MAG: hypothetical protein QOJ52_1043 [Acidimicrobiaceae bacterium]|nr:hypothetical protein [Acidimicrobiaceae bacterium]MDQ1440452.1 hypothetical protein [Acidimicrobiaceae bacterium]
MTPPDPWQILGLPAGSSLAEARAARRRLAKRLHPDVHTGRPPAEQAELSARMTAVNRALTDIEARWAAEATVKPVSPAPGPEEPGDPDTFSVELLPVEAFEALFLAAYGLGDILVTDEPYLLELYLTEPAPCFCRLTLVPEAGGSIVTVDVGPAAESGEAPTASAVVEVLVAELNALATT